VIDGLFSYGGTRIKLLNLVRESDQDRFRHVFLVFANHPKNLNWAVRKAGAIIGEVYRRRNWDLRLVQDILRAIRLYRADLINTHFARADIYGTVAGVIARKPVIKSVHGIWWNKS
jgi:hypothetical protein